MDEVEILPYTEEMNEDCMKLEALCPQGKEYRLSFVRDYFHKRAENYNDWRILVARKGEKIVGVTAVAVKMIELKGKRIKGGFYSDLRVHPDHRRQGIAQKLGWASKDWALERGAEYHYLYCIDDNRAMKAIGKLVKRTPHTPWPILSLGTGSRIWNLEKVFGG